MKDDKKVRKKKKENRKRMSWSEKEIAKVKKKKM